MTKVVNVKVKFIRKNGYDNLREWLKDENNLYIGRRGRVFIKEKNGEKTVFHYEASKWQNPFTVKKYGLEKSLELFENYAKQQLIGDIFELKGKNLGCWCKDGEQGKCHGDVLLNLLKDEETREQSPMVQIKKGQ